MEFLFVKTLTNYFPVRELHIVLYLQKKIGILGGWQYFVSKLFLRLNII